MNDRAIAALLFIAYAVNSQWAFRCQRVARGILLVARDSAAAHGSLFGSLAPTSYVVSIWLGRLLWIGAAFFAWRAWNWWGLISVVIYGFTLGTLVDTISPWPSYRRLLNLIRRRITSGSAGLEAITLLPTVHQIDQQLAGGMHFEKVTVGVWLSRAVPKPAASTVTTARPTRATRCLDLANTAHRILGTYIGIHDNILGVPWHRALRRIIPIPGIFDRIPYAEHRDTLATLSTELRGVRDEAEALTASGALSTAEVRFCRSLQEYSDALLDSIVRLQEICHIMAPKADGYPGPTWNDYQRKLTDYGDSCKRYAHAGERLNVECGTLKHEA
jgi:hypothetical protein